MTTRKLPDWLNGYLRYTANSEPPTSYKTWVAISVMASCLKRKCQLSWGTLTFFPNMYIVLVGPSGKCRKGTAMGPGFKFLKEMGIKMSAEAITREALIREMKQSGDTQIDATGKITMHSSLTIYSQELTVFLGYNNQQLMADLADWYDCRDQWTYRTKNMGTDDITGVWVNLIGATTPELLQTTLPRDAIGGGLTSRMVFIFEQNKSKIVASPFLSAEERALEKDLLLDLEQIHMLSGEFKPTSAFLDRWVEWYTQSDKNPPFEDARFAGYIERRPTHLLKLSTILSASRSNAMAVDVQDFDRALGLLTAAEKTMRNTFGGMGRSDIGDIVHRVLTTIVSMKEVEYSELLRRFYYDADIDELERVVNTIVGMGHVTIEYQGKTKILRSKL